MQPLKITNSPPLFITRFSLYLTKNHSWSTCGRREWKYKFNYFIIILYRNGMLDFSNVHVRIRIYNTCHGMIIMWGLLWIMRCTYTYIFFYWKLNHVYFNVGKILSFIMNFWRVWKYVRGWPLTSSGSAV